MRCPMSGARAAAPAGEEGDKGRVATTKVSRYWAGKRPDAADDVPEHAGAGVFGAPEAVQRTPMAPAVVVKKADPRLARLAKTDISEARNDAARRHRREIHTATVVRRDRAASDADTTSKHTSDEAAQVAGQSEAPSSSAEAGGAAASGRGVTDVEATRQARRMRALELQRQREAEEAQAQADASSSEYETDEDSEYETDSDEEEEGRLVKPVFVAKSDRETIAERERLEMEEQLKREAEQARKETRVKETSALVAQIVDAEKFAEREKTEGPTNTPSDVDTDSDEDEETEFNLWQRRELARLKREQAMRDGLPADAAAAAEKRMLASMTDAEREEYARKNAAAAASKPARGKQKFMQKYYHKGAFFQEAADDDRGTVGGDQIYRRDFSAPTGEDKFDREALPTVMQVRNFGRAGRTKWTHLAAEDTTALAEPDPTFDFSGEAFGMIKRKVEQMGGGMAQEFVKPKRTKT